MPFKGGVASSSTWGRPADWPALPPLGASDQKFVGLYAVYNETSNFVALRATTSAGNVQYDWGDGTAPDVVASGVNAQHNYSYAASGLSPVTTEGFKTAIVTVTPVSGNLTGINLQQKHNQAGLSNYTPQWLDIGLNGSSITSITLSSATYPLRAVRNVYIGTIGTLTNTSAMLYRTAALKNLNLFNTASVTDASFMFYESSIAYIPGFNFSACTTLQGFAYGARNLTISPNITTTSALLNIETMYWLCESIIKIGMFNTSGVTNAITFCGNTYCLQVIDALALSSATNLTTCLLGTVSLQSFLPTGITRTISFAGCKMSTAALITVLNNLGTAAGAQTVTITGNWGNDGSAPLVTAINGAIAKGWTVVS